MTTFQERIHEMKRECRGFPYGELCKPCESRIDGFKDGYAFRTEEMIKAFERLERMSNLTSPQRGFESRHINEKDWMWFKELLKKKEAKK